MPEPGDQTSDERTLALATILAAGLLRLRRPVNSPLSPLDAALENYRESLSNELAVSGTKSVTVYAG
jgi:hypothetical protein